MNLELMRACFLECHRILCDKCKTMGQHAGTTKQVESGVFMYKTLRIYFSPHKSASFSSDALANNGFKDSSAFLQF